MMSPMEIVSTLVGRKRAMVDLATLCETPPPPLLASPTAAAGKSESHDNNNKDNKETGKGVAEQRNMANVALCLASMGDPDAPLVSLSGCQKTALGFFLLQTHACGHDASKNPISVMSRPLSPPPPFNSNNTRRPPRVRPFPQHSSEGTCHL